ncbi:hypothetical protein B0H14DRAFT_2638198 [Mycena olivaceomarginata]|nr:hypothetical protein B0H14DRAFT_2638198 [Mycena olivaceomarginata]
MTPKSASSANVAKLREPSTYRHDARPQYARLEGSPGALVPSEIHRTMKTIPKVCNATFCGPDMIGNVHLLFYLKPDDPDHENPQLEAIFSAAIPHIADILATFDHNHPVIEYSNYLRPQWEVDGTHAAVQWCPLIYDPDFCPPTFRRLNDLQVETELVPQGAGNEIEQNLQGGLKRKIYRLLFPDVRIRAASRLVRLQNRFKSRSPRKSLGSGYASEYTDSKG